MLYTKIKHLNHNLLVIDLEATCSKGESIPRKEMEIIEIGAVMVDKNSLEPIGEFQCFIKPVRHPQLTEFCTSLTSIQQADVDQGISYAEAIQNLQDWMAESPEPIFSSWGEFDKSQFKQDCAYHDVSYPFSDKHMNIKQQFTAQQGLDHVMGLSKALSMADMTFVGRAHRGIDDARNMVRLLPYIVGNETI